MPRGLVKGVFPSTGLAVIWGPPKCGKSFWMLDVLMHVALGWEYRGRRVTQGAVVYCALEGQANLPLRKEAFWKAKLADKPEADPPLFLMTRPINLVKDGEALAVSIREQVGDTTPSAVCIDTLNRSLHGSESSDEDMSEYVRAADAVRDAFDCLVIIIHHCGHGADRPSGHSSLMGALDVQIGVKRDASDNVVAEIELAKDGADGLQFVSRLRVVEVAVDQDGEPITSLVVDPVDGEDAMERRPSKPPPITKTAKTALRALHKTIADIGESAPASNNIPQNVRVATVEQWRAGAYLSGISDSAEIKARQKAFKRAHDELVACGTVGEWNGSVWIAKDETGRHF
jgi:hypothetical protein